MCKWHTLWFPVTLFFHTLLDFLLWSTSTDYGCLLVWRVYLSRGRRMCMRVGSWPSLPQCVEAALCPNWLKHRPTRGNATVSPCSLMSAWCVPALKVKTTSCRKNVDFCSIKSAGDEGLFLKFKQSIVYTRKCKKNTVKKVHAEYSERKNFLQNLLQNIFCLINHVLLLQTSCCTASIIPDSEIWIW